MPRTNETRHIKWHETCKCKCKLDATLCNNKQRWMMINVAANVKNWLIVVYVIKDILGIPVIVSVNLINHVMLVKNCKVEKGWKINVMKECSENTDEAKLTEIALFESTEFYTVFIVLDVTALTTCIDIGAYYTYKYMES